MMQTTARSPSVLRPALTLFSIRLVLEQIGLALLVFLLYVVWLRMPDASVLDVIGSAVLALVVLAVEKEPERIGGLGRRLGVNCRGKHRTCLTGRREVHFLAVTGQV